MTNKMLLSTVITIALAACGSDRHYCPEAEFQEIEDAFQACLTVCTLRPLDAMSAACDNQCSEDRLDALDECTPHPDGGVSDTGTDTNPDLGVCPFGSLMDPFYGCLSVCDRGGATCPSGFNCGYNGQVCAVVCNPPTCTVDAHCTDISTGIVYACDTGGFCRDRPLVQGGLCSGPLDGGLP
jgi:hypothetical protein